MQKAAGCPPRPRLYPHSPCATPERQATREAGPGRDEPETPRPGYPDWAGLTQPAWNMRTGWMTTRPGKHRLLAMPSGPYPSIGRSKRRRDDPTANERVQIGGDDRPMSNRPPPMVPHLHTERTGEPTATQLYLEVGCVADGISQSSTGALSTKRAACSRWVNNDLPMASTLVTCS